MNSNGIEQVLAQMRELSAAAAAKPAASEQEVSNVSFSSMLKDSIGEVNESQLEASAMKKSFELGQDDVNLADVMISVQKSNISFEAMMQVRNKLVEAYKEVMNMPV
ncbi:MAG: flagellar hook-basal body complex protein FliE [Gammaproteobacteria bacterium]|nr:flagellar hook-basal body complex protein FliE [Gammaproteobacteria bacterium]